MDPNVKVLIQALRAGKCEGEALQDFCWASASMPINIGEQRNRNPEDCTRAYPDMAMAMTMDAFDKGADDAAIEEAFRAGRAIDAQRGIVWRAMLKSERPTFGQLVRAMTLDDQMKATEFFGTRSILHAVAGLIL